MSEPAITKPSKKRKQGRWRRWLWRLVVATVVARLLLGLFLLPLASFGASFAGLSLSWRSASLSLLGLSLHIEDLVVRDAEDETAPPLLAAQDLIADLSMGQLLSGELSIVDISLAGARVTVHQGNDGKLRLPAAWLAPTPIAAVPPQEDDREPLSFDPGIRIASARLHDLQLDYVDFRSDPPRHYTGKLDLDIADVGFADRSGSVLARLHVPQLCDELWLQAELETSASHAAVKLKGAMRGFRPQTHDLPDRLIDAIDGAGVVDLAIDAAVTADVLPGAPRQPALQGHCDLRLQLDGIERTSIDATFGPPEVRQQGAAGVAMPFALAVHCDSIVEQLELTAGRLELGDDRTALTADIAATGITCRRIRPILTAAGLQLPPSSMDLRTSIDVDFGDALSLDLGRLSLRTESNELLALTRVAVRDLRTENGVLAIGAIELLGPELSITHAADGAMIFAGVRTLPVAETEPAANATAAPLPTKPDTPSWPKVRLGSFDWSGARLVFTDESTTPPASLVLEDLRVRADGITIGDEAPPGRVVISARVPSVIDKLTADLTITPTVDSLAPELTLRATGVTANALAPWLQPLGITSELRDGEFAMAVSAKVTRLVNGIACDARVADLRLVDGDDQWLSMRLLEGNGLQVTSNGIDAGTWTIEQPSVAVHRDDEALHLLGLRLAGPRGPEVSANAPAGPADQQPRRRLALPNTNEPLLKHGVLRVADATLTWTDARFPDRNWSIGLDATLGENYGTGQPLPVQANVRLPGAIQALDVDGTLVLTPARTVLDGTLTASGIKGSEFASFLPDGVACTLTDGSLRAGFAATITGAKDRAIDARVSGLALLDQGIELAAIDEIVVDVPTVSSDEVHVRDAHIRGLRALVTQTADALLVPGFALSSAPADSQAPAPHPPSPTPPADAPPTKPIVAPRLRIDALAFELERLVVRDQRAGAAEPLQLHVDVKLREPWLGDPEAEEPSPMAWLLEADCQPLGARLVADGEFSPFELSPTLDIRINMTGLDTTSLTQVAPGLAAQVQGHATALEASAIVHGRLDLKRRHARDFPTDRPFGGELIIDQFVLRDAATDQTFASVASIDIIARAIDARTGGILLRSIDIDEPMLIVDRNADGLLAGGFRFPPAPAASEPTQPAAGGKPRTEAASAGELAIDRLRLLGLTCQYRDSTTTPPTHLHLADTDAELQRFSTRALTEARPMSFSVAVRGGNVELEKRVIRSSVLAGILGSAAEAVTGGADDHDHEQRPLVDQITATGQLQLHPVLKGRVQVGIDTLELAAFRGLAKSGGVDLADGLYDMRADLDLKGHDGIDVQSRHVLTWLSMTEPPDGPITTYLKLPAGLQAVLFLLRNNNDEQRLPINLHVPAAGLSKGAIADLAVESLTRIIASAVGSAGSRVGSTVTGGILDGSSEVPDVSSATTFEPGSPLPTATDFEALAAAVSGDPTLHIVLTHELGAADLRHANELANPAVTVVAATVARLQTTRRERAATREPLTHDVVALYAAGKSQEAVRQLARLRTIDTELGEIEIALADALGMLGARNQRAARRRTREAALELAEARLDALETELLAGRRELVNRIELRPGRGIPIDGVAGGGRVVAVIRRRSAR